MTLNKTRLDVKIGKVELKIKQLTTELEELKQARKNLDSLNEDEEIKVLTAKIEELANKRNLPKERVLKAISGKAGALKEKKPVLIKYRDPVDDRNTWTGRGIKPLWLQRYLAAGKDISEFEV